MPRKGENIYRRKDGRWEARVFDFDGRKYKSVYGKTYAEARQKQRAMLAKPSQEAKVLGSMITVETTAQRWLQNVRLRVKDSTFAKYQRVVEHHVIPLIGCYDVSTASTVQLEQYAGQLVSKGLSSKTVCDVLTVVKSIFKYAQANGQPITCSLEGIKLKRDNREMRVLSKQEQTDLTEYLLDNADVLKLGVLLSLSTGIRIGELCALRWEDIDLETGKLHISNTMQRIQDLSGTGAKTRVILSDPKSKSSIRIIPLSSTIVNKLRPFSCHPQTYFLTRDRKHFMEPRALQNHFKKYLTASGIADANFHALRHTFATRAVEEGFEIKSLSEILGHSSVKITLDKYVHSSFELKQAQMEKMPI